jgi:lipopolysaccharide assembly protein A
MRWVYMSIVGLLALAVLILAIQNLHLVTVSFLGFSLRAPLALVIIGTYLLGMATGSGLFWLIKRSVAGARAKGGEH